MSRASATSLRAPSKWRLGEIALWAAIWGAPASSGTGLAGASAVGAGGRGALTAVKAMRCRAAASSSEITESRFSQLRVSLAGRPSGLCPVIEAAWTSAVKYRPLPDR